MILYHILISPVPFSPLKMFRYSPAQVPCKSCTPRSNLQDHLLARSEISFKKCYYKSLLKDTPHSRKLSTRMVFAGGVTAAVSSTSMY